MMQQITMTCNLCDEEYTVDDREIEYITKVRMLHPLVVCKKCAGKEMVHLTDEKKEWVMDNLGNPQAREKLWDTLFEKYPQIKVQWDIQRAIDAEADKQDATIL